MNENDDDQQAQLASDPNSGLGHDPLEWLQEDDEVTKVETEVTSSASLPSESVRAEPIAESQPEPQQPEPQTAEVAPVNASVPENQSYTFDNHKAILKLPEKLTVQIIEPLHSEWKTLLYDIPQSLEVDASKVKDIDAAGMQLFYALVQQMVIKGSDVAIINVGGSLQRHFRLFGLDDFFAQYTHAA